jgi:hypothetical protein
MLNDILSGLGSGRTLVNAGVPGSMLTNGPSLLPDPKTGWLDRMGSLLNSIDFSSAGPVLQALGQQGGQGRQFDPRVSFAPSPAIHGGAVAPVNLPPVIQPSIRR